MLLVLISIRPKKECSESIHVGLEKGQSSFIMPEGQDIQVGLDPDGAILKFWEIEWEGRR